MGSFRDSDFVERQDAANRAKKAALEKFRQNAADPTFAERQAARAASAADRATVKKVREAAKAQQRAADAEAAKQAERDAAREAERARAESAERELALNAEQKAARDARYAARKARSKGR